MLDYKKTKNACLLCSSCTITVHPEGTVLRCSEYNAEHTMKRDVLKCSAFYLRRTLQDGRTKQERREIEDYFKRDLF